jgi:hypothetical protein
MSQQVVLKALPPGGLDDLRVEDQEAISKAVGKPTILNGYEDDGRAELEFTHTEGVIHIIMLIQTLWAGRDGRKIPLAEVCAFLTPV